MNELVQNLVAKAKEHKAILIKSGSAIVGGLLGATIASVVLSNMDEEDEFVDFPGVEDEA